MAGLTVCAPRGEPRAMRVALLFVLFALAYTSGINGTTGVFDAGSDALPGDTPRLSLDAPCADPPAVELPREGTRYGSIVVARYDTRDAPSAPPPFANTACALRRDRAAVFRYTPDEDGWVRVSGSAVIEVFAGCKLGYAPLGCARGAIFAGSNSTVWVELLAGRAVYIVVTHPDTSASEASYGSRGEVEVRRLDPLPEGATCDTLARACGPGLACIDARCARPPAPAIACEGPDRACPEGLVCTHAGLCALPRELGASCGTIQCAAGARCLSEPPAVATCVPARRAGEPCGSATIDRTLCEAGTWCGSDGLCRPFVPDGGPCVEGACELDSVCASGRCARREARPYGPCDARDPSGCPLGHACVAGRCHPATQGVRQPCNLNRGTLCAAPLHCLEGTCVACVEGRDCPTGTRCGANHVCGVAGDEGQACRATLPRCDGDARCVGGVCRAPLSLRSPDGTEDGRCRDGVPARDLDLCDPGLRCEEGFCLRVLPRDAPCTHVAGVCAGGSSCVGDATGASSCVRDGAERGACRVENARAACDPGLACAGTCRPATLGAGEPCLSSDETCAPGLSCSIADGRCAPEGSLGAGCRATDNPCDVGLACERVGGYRCVAFVAEAAACGGARRCAPEQRCNGEGRCAFAGTVGTPCDVTCRPGLSCDHARGGCTIAVGPNSECGGFRVCGPRLWCHLDRCIPSYPGARGLLDGLCRPEAPFCDPGLRCLGSYCVRVVGEGEPCGSSACGDGLACWQGTCRPRGAIGLPCRETASPCDGGAFCYAGYCYATAAPGTPCDRESAPCAPGHTCARPVDAASGLELRCQPDGTRGASCRFDGGAPCDDGLRCHPALGRCVP